MVSFCFHFFQYPPGVALNFLSSQGSESEVESDYADSSDEALEEQGEEEEQEFQQQLQTLIALEESRPLETVAVVTWSERNKPAEGIASLSFVFLSLTKT